MVIRADSNLRIPAKELAQFQLLSTKGSLFQSGNVISDTMDWQVVFYMDSGGKEHVKDFILAQPDGAIAEILHVLKLLREFNIKLGMPYVRKIGKSGLRELRIKHSSDLYRIFYFAYRERKFVLLHAILKKTAKTPESDLEIAVKRMNEYKSKC